MARVVPKDRISCKELVLFMRTAPEVRKNFDLSPSEFVKRKKKIQSIEQRIQDDINRLDEDLII